MNADLVRERSQQQALLDNLQALLTAREKNENDLKQYLKHEIATLQQERFIHIFF